IVANSDNTAVVTAINEKSNTHGVTATVGDGGQLVFVSAKSASISGLDALGFDNGTVKLAGAAEDDLDLGVAGSFTVNGMEISVAEGDSLADILEAAETALENSGITAKLDDGRLTFTSEDG